MQESMFPDVEKVPKYGSKFTANALKAIAWYAENYGLKVELSVPPLVTFSMKELNESHAVSLSDIVNEYKRWRKEESKRAAREKRQEIKR